MLEPATSDELMDCVRDHDRVAVQGGCTKRRLVGEFDGRSVISTTKLSGMVEYRPDEYIFTARAGTKMSEIEAALAEHGQYLPCDVPLVENGATLGGAVAAGINGAGSFRFGGLRDFILAVRFVDGVGRLVTGGGKVVKNAAGFDLPKLMVGSLGRLGVLAEITMKVFPKPSGVSYSRVRCSNLAAAVSALNDLASQPWDLDALELIPSTGELKLRLRGEPEALGARRERIGADADEAGQLFWAEQGAFPFGRNGDYLARVPITPDKIAMVAERFPECAISIGGNVAWVASPELADIGSLGLPALVVRGKTGEAAVGIQPSYKAHAAIKRALDPEDRFPPAVMT